MRKALSLFPNMKSRKAGIEKKIIKKEKCSQLEESSPIFFENVSGRKGCEGSDQDQEETDDDGEIVTKNLSAVILQYLEACGLKESYTTFYDECISSGMLIPNNYKAEIESGISLQDIETLLMHFDQENGDALLELWDVLTNMVDISQHSQEVEKITFYIQIYTALIPFRQKMSEEKKSLSMQKLREYFQTKTETCTTDKEMLSLFALPFVTDPENHPVFANLFKAAWVKKLRARIKTLARVLCSPNKLVTRENTDLSKMFVQCSKAVPHDIECFDGQKICVLSNVKPFQFTSGVEVKDPTLSRRNPPDGNFSPAQLLQRLNDLVGENERYKVEESKYEKQCAQLLHVSLLLAQSLEEAAQGKEVNMDKLRYEVSSCLPMSMQKQNGKEKVPKSSSNITMSSSSDSEEASNPNNLLEDNNEVSMIEKVVKKDL